MNKKIFVLLLILTVMLSVASVNAVEIDNETSNLSTEEIDDSLIELSNDDYLGASSEGTFSDLANELANADGELNLTRNYVYSSSDASYKGGIFIFKKIIINGNGFTINGNNQARAFGVNCDSVVLKSISFVNCFSTDDGGAIYWSGNNNALFNCSFVNSKISSGYGGAIYWRGNNNILFNCSFMDSETNSGDGGAIYWLGNNNALFNCSFANSKSNSIAGSSGGGAVCVRGYGGIIHDCIFIDSKVYSKIGSYSNCYSYSYGGAIYWSMDGGLIYNCVFINSSSISDAYSTKSPHSSCYGGAIYSDGNKNILFNCSFINSSSISLAVSSSTRTSSYGGAVYWRGDNGTIYNCNFLNSNLSSIAADVFGGAIYWEGNDCQLFNCTFENSTLSSNSGDFAYGGAIYEKGNNNYLFNCSFINSLAGSYYSVGVGGAVCWDGEDGTLFNCEFSKSQSIYLQNYRNGGAIYWKGNEGTIYNYTVDSNIEQIYISNKLKNAPLKSKLLINVSNIVFGNLLVIKPFIDTGASGTISVYIDGILKSTLGVGKTFNIQNLSVGKHEITVKYNGDQNFEPVEYNNVFRVFTVYPIVASDTQIIQGTYNYFKAKLYDEYGEILSNKYASFNVNGNEYNVLTNDNGIATLNIDLPVGEYEVTTVNMLVNENTTNKLLIFHSVVAENIISESGDIEFKATFLDYSAKPLSNTGIIFVVDGNRQSIRTDVNGIATLKLKLTGGTHTITSINTLTGENTTNKVRIVSSIDSIINIAVTNASYTKNPKLTINVNSNYLNANVIITISDNKGYSEEFSQKASKTITKEFKD